MKLADCVACHLPVLELEGQFEKLDSYYTGPDGPPPETAGWWHARCLLESSACEAWARARLRNFVEVRGARVIERLPHWTVVELPRSGGERLALGDRGRLLSLLADRTDWRTVAGGLLRPIAATSFTLEAEPALIAQIQRGLTSPAAAFPLLEVMGGLGIADRVVDPIALEGGAFRLVPALQPYWTASAVTARVEYAELIPVELAALA